MMSSLLQVGEKEIICLDNQLTFCLFSCQILYKPQRRWVCSSAVLLVSRMTAETHVKVRMMEGRDEKDAGLA